MIIFKAPIHKIYKMMVLWSKSEGHIKQSYYTSLAKDIIDSYGFPEVARLEAMIKQGLIQVGGNMIKFTSSPFIQLTNVLEIFLCQFLEFWVD